MANSPYTPLPRDKSGMDNPNSPAPVTAVARYAAGTAASSVVTFTDNTTTLEVGAVNGGGVLLKWIGRSDSTASVTASNFDNFIPADTVRRFAIPIERQGTASVVGANIQNGLYNRAAWIGIGTPSSSVIATEYA